MSTPLAGRPDKGRLQPLWDRVDANRFRLVLYLALFAVVTSLALGALIAIVLVLLTLVEFRFSPWNAELLAGRLLRDNLFQLWFGGLLVAVLYEAWALLRSEKWLIARLGAEFVPKGELLDVKFAMKDMALAAGISVAPALYLMPDAAVNAFIFKAPSRRPVLGVTQGFIDRLTAGEQRAVFANLTARLITGDTVVSSAVTSLLAPLNFYRAHRIHRLDAEDEMIAAMARSSRKSANSPLPASMRSSDANPYAAMFYLMPVLIPAIVLGEIVAAAQRRSQLTAGEKADAEGMLLLKDPQSMLSALEKCVTRDNYVPAASEHLADLFYFWTGISTNDNDDPEWRRVARLREVLGVEGWVPAEAEDTGLPEGLVAPAAPRLDE